MKRLCIYLSVFVLLTACSNSKNPTETAKEFVTAINLLRFEEASKLVTDDTKKVLIEYKRQIQLTNALTELTKQIDQKNQSKLELDSFTSTTNESLAVVTNSKFKINLDKVDGEWRVVATPDLVQKVVYATVVHPEIKKSWENLQNQYIRRADVVNALFREIGNKPEMENDISSLRTAMDEVKVVSEITQSNIKTFIAQQQKIERLIGALLSKIPNSYQMESVAILEGTENRIVVARRDFNSVAANYDASLLIEVSASDKPAPPVDFGR